MRNDAYQKASLKLGRVRIEQKQDHEKLNPNSLRFLLGYIILDFFNGNLSRAADRLRDFGGKYSERRSDRERKNITTKSLTSLILDKEYFAYWHLEIVARFLEMPVGALFAISRFYSYKRYGDLAGARIFIECMRSMLNDMEKTINSDLQETRNLQRMSACFSELKDHDSHSPMLF